jgi:hypothetical protein
VARSLDELEVAFCDEDTATWTAAARELGKLAHDDARAREFLKGWLEREAQTETNIHRFRHACCGLASYLSRPDADRTPFASTIEREIMGPLSYLAFLGLTPDATIRDLVPLGLADDFDAWRTSMLEKRKKDVAKFGSGGSEKALAANQQKLESLEALGPDSKLPKDFQPQTKLHDHSPWALTSYFAGLSKIPALLGLPVLPLVRGLAKLGVERRNGGLPFVLNVPDLLREIRGEISEADWEAAVTVLIENVSPTWINERLHYNDYMLSLSACRGTFYELWGKGITKPEWIETELFHLRTEDENEAARTAARLMRRIAREYFSDDWRWSELDEGARFSLNVFTLLMSHGIDPFRETKAGKKLPTPSVRHRIAILMRAIEASYHSREQVLPALVRCLKLLLDRDLRGRGKGDDLVETCARHVSMVRPLVAEWQLPGTMRKDLATIVCRILLAAYRSDRAVFTNLLYTVLFELPDEVLFRELIEYSTEAEVSNLVAEIVASIERWRRPSDPSATVKTYRPDTEAIAIYERFARKLSAIGAGEKSLGWVERLPRLVAHVSRMPDAPQSDRDQAAIDNALFWMLRAKHQDVESWELDSPRGKLDRKGAQWAAQELARRSDQRTREVYDRFLRLLDDVQILESDCLPEMGRPKPSDDLVRQWRRLIATLDALIRLCDEELPYLERELCVHLLKERVASVEHRLHSLVRVLEKEEEKVAIELLAAPVHADTALIQQWMLDRYMMREIAATLRFRVLGLLTNAPIIFVWLLLPFLMCILLNMAGLERWAGIPFTSFTLFNLVLVCAFFVEARRNRGAASSTSKFMLPQITAALFLGAWQVINTEEAWLFAVLEYPWVRIFTVAMFLVIGFLFTREVLLGTQLGSRAHWHRKNERALSVMALVLWQSSVLVGVFGILSGRVMGATVDQGRFTEAVGSFGHWLPIQVHVGRLVLDPAAEMTTGGYAIYPWALMTWTVQVFFFSAIFERIMRGSD